MKRTTPPKGEIQVNTALQRLQTLSDVMSRASLASRMGQQYGGERDVFEALGYPSSIAFKDYEARYKRQDIAKAIINRPVSYTWKGPALLTEPGTEDDTAFEKEWKKLEMRLKLKSNFIRLDKLSSIGQYGVLLLGFSDVSKIVDFSQPVKEKSTLLYVKPLAQGSAKIATYVTNPTDPRYGLVKTYDISYDNPGENASTTEYVIHYSRVIHVVPELLENEVEGEPALCSVWNRLIDLEKLVGGSAEMFWRGARPGYQGKIDPEYTLTPKEEAKLEAQIDEYEHNLRRMLVNSGIDFEALETQVSDPSNHVDVQIQMISAITGIPKRVLTGSERGELSSGQDITGWYSVIQTRREEHAEAKIIRPFVDRMIEVGILPEPSTGEYQVSWSDLFAASDKEQAEIGRIRATALKEYETNPSAQMTIPPEAFMEFMLGLDETEREKIKRMSSKAVVVEIDALPTPAEQEIMKNEKKK